MPWCVFCMCVCEHTSISLSIYPTALRIFAFDAQHKVTLLRALFGGSAHKPHTGQEKVVKQTLDPEGACVVLLTLCMLLSVEQEAEGK